MRGAIWVFLATATALVGDFVIKKASEANGKAVIPLIIAGVLIYGINAFAFYFSYKHVEFSSTAVYFSIGTLLTSVLLGAFYFKEQITTGEWVGIIFGILSIVILTKYAG